MGRLPSAPSPVILALIALPSIAVRGIDSTLTVLIVTRQREGKKRLFLVESREAGTTSLEAPDRPQLLGPTCMDIGGSEVIWAFFKKHSLAQQIAPADAETPRRWGSNILRWALERPGQDSMSLSLAQTLRPLNTRPAPAPVPLEAVEHRPHPGLRHTAAVRAGIAGRADGPALGHADVKGFRRSVRVDEAEGRMMGEVAERPTARHPSRRGGSNLSPGISVSRMDVLIPEIGEPLCTEIEVHSSWPRSACACLSRPCGPATIKSLRY